MVPGTNGQVHKRKHVLLWWFGGNEMISGGAGVLCKVGKG